MKDHNGRLTRCYISLLPFKITIRPPLIGKCQHGGRSLLQVAKQHQPLEGDGCWGRAAALSVLLHGLWVVLAHAVSHTHTPYTHTHNVFFSIFYHSHHHSLCPSFCGATEDAPIVDFHQHTCRHIANSRHGKECHMPQVFVYTADVCRLVTHIWTMFSYHYCLLGVSFFVGYTKNLGQLLIIKCSLFTEVKRAASVLSIKYVILYFMSSRRDYWSCPGSAAQCLFCVWGL